MTINDQTLILGTYYKVFDWGMNEWKDDYEYVGFDTNNREHMFRGHEFGNDFHFIGVNMKDIECEVTIEHTHK